MTLNGQKATHGYNPSSRKSGVASLSPGRFSSSDGLADTEYLGRSEGPYCSISVPFCIAVALRLVNRAGVSNWHIGHQSKHSEVFAAGMVTSISQERD